MDGGPYTRLALATFCLLLLAVFDSPDGRRYASLSTVRASFARAVHIGYPQWGVRGVMKSLRVCSSRFPAKPLIWLVFSQIASGYCFH